MAFMTDDTFEPPRRRKASVEATTGREAANLVRDLNRQLGAWQAASVKLHTMAERLHSVGRADPAVVDEAHALFNAVDSEARRFEALLPDVSEGVSHHGRISDTRQSFRMVTERLRASLTLMGARLPSAEDDQGAG